MVENLRGTIDILKQVVRFNLDLLHQGERKIKELLKEPASNKRSEKLDKMFNSNKALLKENNDAILLQKEMLLFIERYYSDIDKFPSTIDLNDKTKQRVKLNKQKTEIKREDYFDLTINGALDFDKQHPFFKDKNFFNELLNHYTKIEDYETCSKLKIFIKENKNSEY